MSKQSIEITKEQLGELPTCIALFQNQNNPNHCVMLRDWGDISVKFAVHSYYHDTGTLEHGSYFDSLSKALAWFNVRCKELI